MLIALCKVSHLMGKRARFPIPGPMSSPYWVEQRQFCPAVSSGHQGE